MKWFNLSIEEYSKEVLDNKGFHLRAISVIKYPIYFIKATIRKYAEDDTYSLDYHILKIINYYSVTNVKDINLILGVMGGVIRWRIDILEKSGYVIASDNELKLTKDGEELINKPDQRIEITMTENYYIDGITLKPLAKEFYHTNKHFGAIHTFIEHGDSDFEPDIVHTPPDDTILDNIMSLPVEKRSIYSIPEGLIEVMDFDPIRMIHPLAIAYLSNENEEIVKKLIDCCDTRSNEGFLKEEEKILKDSIEGFCIKGMEKRTPSGDKSITQFSTNWNTEISRNKNVIFDLTMDHLKSIISNKIKIEIIESDDIQILDTSIKWKINKQYFRDNSDNKNELVEYLLKKEHFMYQHETTGVWLVFIEFLPGDQFVKDLLKINDMIDKNNYSLKQLIQTFGLQYLRSLLIDLEKYFVLEDLDSELYLSKIVSGNYIKPNN